MSNLEKLMRAGMRVLLVGPPGTAKTARIVATGKACSRRLFLGIGGRTCDLSDRVDFGGALIPDMAAGITRTLPLVELREILDCEEPAIWFIDEIGRAALDVQGGICSLMDTLRRTRPNVVVWAATNRPGDKAGVMGLSEQLRSRFDCAFSVPVPGAEDKADGAVMLGTWAEEVASWCEWALDQGAPAEIVAWHRSTTGRTLYGWKPCADPAVRMPDFRSWATVIRLWGAGLRDLRSVASAIGKGPAAEFLAFAALADGLPTPDQVWLDPDGAPVPTDPAALYLVAGMISAAATQATAGALCRYFGRMPRVYAALAARDAYRRLGAKLAGNRDWQKWFVENQQLFATG